MVAKGGDSLKVALNEGRKEVSKELREKKKALLSSAEVIVFVFAALLEVS
jgi:hypothetical protein